MRLGVWVALGVLCGRVTLGQAVDGALAVSNASAEPGRTVRLRLLASFDAPLHGVLLDFTYDPTRLRYEGFDIAGSAARDADPLSVFHSDHGGEGACGILPGRGENFAWSIPPGANVHVGSLVFLVLPRAAEGIARVTPVRDIAATGSSSALIVDRAGETMTTIPAVYTAGSVEVLAPDGPRPVADLTCEQFLDRIRLRFEPAEEYNEIRVTRNGSNVASLPGDARSFEEPFSSTGYVTYRLTASRDGETSFPAECKLLSLPPSAPPVEDLNCTGATVVWTNPLGYDEISVSRDGASIATLSGDAIRFDDPSPPADLCVYTVEGKVDAFSSPGVSCVSNGSWIVEVGDVLVPLDEKTIVIPMYVTTPATVEGFDFHLDIDTSRFRLVKDYEAALAGTIDQPAPEYFHMGVGGPFAAPTVGIIYDQLAPREEEKDLVPGLRQKVFNFIFEPIGAFAENEAVPVRIHQASFVQNRGASSRRPDLLIPGEIRFGRGQPPGPRGLRASVEDGVRLSWKNAFDYEKVVIARNGAPAGETDGSDETWVDEDAPRGVHTYKVYGVAGGRKSFPASVFISTFTPRGAFIRGDANGDGKLDIADPIATLDYLFHSRGGVRCQDAADTDDDGILTITDTIAALQFLFQAQSSLKAPGVSYPWFDPTPDSLDCDR